MLIKLTLRADQGDTSTADRGVRSRYPEIQRSRGMVVSRSAEMLQRSAANYKDFEWSLERLRVPKVSLDGSPNKSTMYIRDGFPRG